MNLVFIRHGESDHNKDGYISTNVESMSMLTEDGIKQVSESAKEIKDLGIDFGKIYSSPLKRCVQTSEIICYVLNISKDDIIYDINLKEIDMGEYDGKLLSEYPYGYINGSHNHEPAHSFGGETLEDVEERIINFIPKLKENSIIVSHRAPIRVFIKYLVGYEIKVKCGGYYLLKNWKINEPTIDLSWETYKRISKNK